jgi:hypothetical protein
VTKGQGRSPFPELQEAALQRMQARWESVKLLIINEKSMLGRAQLGRIDA